MSRSFLSHNLTPNHRIGTDPDGSTKLHTNFNEWLASQPEGNHGPSASLYSLSHFANLKLAGTSEVHPEQEWQVPRERWGKGRNKFAWEKGKSGEFRANLKIGFFLDLWGLAESLNFLKESNEQHLFSILAISNPLPAYFICFYCWQDWHWGDT